MILTLLIFIVTLWQSSAAGCDGIYVGWGTCYDDRSCFEAYNGAHIGCRKDGSSLNSGYGTFSDIYGSYTINWNNIYFRYDRQTTCYDGNWNQVTLNTNRPCHPYCQTCSSNWDYDYCTLCVVNRYRWLSTNHCDYYCPRSTDNSGTGQYKVDNRNCAACTDSKCSWCKATSGGSCVACKSDSYLFSGRSDCINQYYDDNPCQTDFTCRQSNCDIDYYFEVSKATISTSSSGDTYYSFSVGDTYPLPQNFNAAYYRRMSNVCFLCHPYCRRCQSHVNTDCTSCVQIDATTTYYKWYYNNTCHYYCPQGDYGSGSSLGQYVATTSFNLRACNVCDTNCKTCRNAYDQCYVCQNFAFLIDDYTSCNANYILYGQAGKSNCVVCQSVTDGCQSRDKICRNSSCPSYFYFPLYRTQPAANTNSTQNPTYTSFTDSGYTSGYYSTGASGLAYRRLTNICKQCDFRCIQCFGPSNLQCTFCRDQYYEWVGTTHCIYYCPRSADNSATGQYQVNTTNCAYCTDSKCSWCKATSGGQCMACRSDSYLFADQSSCFAQYYNDTPCQTDFTCRQSNCDIDYYFEVSKATISTSSSGDTYYSYSVGDTFPLPQNNIGANYRRMSNVCFLCHPYCRRCQSHVNTDCTSCVQIDATTTYYKWYYNNTCHYYCPQGDYGSGSSLGQYVATTSFNLRACNVCDTNCKTCRNAYDQCYVCQNFAFLIDDYTSCNANYILYGQAGKSNCVVCQSVTDGCQSRDKICRNSSCPSYFYFPLYRTQPAANTNSTQNSRYTNFTDSGYTFGYYSTGASGLAYRRLTNICKQCDFRCIQCFGPTNLECSLCRNLYYKWMDAYTCDSECPPNQYKYVYGGYPNNETVCQYCNATCYQCNGTMYNCSRCKGDNYAFTNANASYLFVYNTSLSNCLTACPVSESNLTKRGYYGSILTMTCYACPTPCSNCNIDVLKSDYPILDCGTDPLCSNGLVCTSCLLGYALVAGKCILEDNCKQYSYYLPTNVSTGWTSDKCTCLYGYYNATYVQCLVRCHSYCLTCNGANQNQCLSCEDGWVLSGTSCVQTNTVYMAYYIANLNLSGVFIPSSVVYKTCGGIQTLWGYRDTTASKSFRFYKTSLSLNFYATDIRMGILFVNQWPSNGALYIKVADTGDPVWSWTYNNFGTYGQQLCGDSRMDYLLNIKGRVPFQAQSSDYTANNTALDYYLRSNADQIGTLYWGIRDVLISVLKCHTDCLTCTGPNSTQCIVCSDSKKRVVNQTCVCNTTAGYYMYSGSCMTGCPTNAGYFTDTISSSCVKPPTVSNCTAPARYGNEETPVTYGNCVQVCPSPLYATEKLMRCIANCATQGQYKFKGKSYTCQDTCPNGYIADPSTGSCVLKCPAPNWFLKLQNKTSNPMCANPCPSGWQYSDLQICVSSCPSGYFKQVVGTRNKCVQNCTNAFGDNTTGSCVLSCPSPSYADPTTHLCVNTCPDTYYTQIKLSNSNRTCELVCESAQWGNPFTMSCTSNPLNCPIGYYADNHTFNCQINCTQSGQVAQNSTRMCQTSCTTGFAYLTLRLCVQICPTTPPMFGYITGKICVSSCNASTSFLFGDIQANRTCVAICSTTPVQTFGQFSTSTCVQKCTVVGEYGDQFHPKRYCISPCTSSPQKYAELVSKRCLTTCPDSYFGYVYTIGGGICTIDCPSSFYGNPLTHLCIDICPTNYYGYPLGYRPCVQKCPPPYFGQNKTTNRVCVLGCDAGYWADNATRVCTNIKTQCTNNTYADSTKRLCVINTNCTANTYSDPFTKGCQTACSNSSYFGDSYTTSCVTLCSAIPDQYSQNGYCTTGCTGGQFADWQNARKCVTNCSRTPIALYGNPSGYRCVLATQCPTNYYGDNNTLQCINPCNSTLPFGDPISKQCVYNCPDDYYGDNLLHLCVQSCNFTLLYYADNITGNCQTLCSNGTYGSNSTTNPRCQINCPPGSFARDTDRICVANCGSGLYGDPIKGKCYTDPFNCSDGYYANSVSHLCELPTNCQTVGTHYFAQNSTKTCTFQCLSPNYGDSKLWMCISVCNETTFGQNDTRLCLTSCAAHLSWAEDQLNLCVANCSAAPISHFSQNLTYTCVEAINCPTDMWASNATKQCVYYCPDASFADMNVTKRCVKVCPDTYYADTSTGTGLCVTLCPDTYRFRDNSTKSCVSICPSSNKTFGDSNADICVYTCPDGYFAQNDTNRRCVSVCADGTWGNQITRKCITNPYTQCQTGTWADNSTHLCTSLCSAANNYYGNNLTKTCITSCPSPSFAYQITRVCIDICPASLVNSGYFGDPSTTSTRKCYLTCQTTGLYRDIAANRTCQSTCTFNSTYKTYKDPTTMSCQAVCSSYPQFLYALNTTPASCVSSCTGLYHMYDQNQTCILTCPVYLDPSSNKCVKVCPKYSSLNTSLYADLTLKTCVVATSCPNNTYASDDLQICTSTCPTNTYIYLKYCVSYCPNDYFINPSNLSCVIPINCPTGYYADNQTRSCVNKCVGTFADRTSRRCIDVCYGTNYGDPFTGFCQTNCSTGLYLNAVTKTCISSCSVGTYLNPSNQSCSSTCPDPYFADDNTLTCVSVCTSNPLTFASTSSGRKCVTKCNSSLWHNLVTRVCATGCSNNTYTYSINQSCVTFCPGPSYYQLGTACVTNCSTLSKYSDDTTRTCVNIDKCPTGYFADPTTYKCVVNCPTSPLQYYASTSLLRCTTRCPEDSYADRQQGACVSNCSQSPPTFAEDNSDTCVTSCPVSAGTFADYTTFRCITPCPNGYFADNRTRSCVQSCGQYLFADSLKVPPSCVAICSDTTFAEQFNFTCVSTCPPMYYADNSSKKCVKFCPYGYFADTNLIKCVTSCPAIAPYADPKTHVCSKSCSNSQYAFLANGTTQGGSCVFYCTKGYFANPRTMKCQTSCPAGLFADQTNNTCSENCNYNKFKDNINHKCLDTCPLANNLFGNRYTRQCVLHCDPNQFLFADSLTRQCQTNCTEGQYADNTTQTCVTATGCSDQLYADSHYFQCVATCYNGTYGYNKQCVSICPQTPDLYADDTTITCVLAQNCPNGTYAEYIGYRKCVETCPITSNTFADNDTRRCLPGCNSPLFADNSTRTCVPVCPNVPELYGNNDTLICVEKCEESYADPVSNLCVQFCPYGLYADSSTLKCVQKCPEGTFGDNITNLCVSTCPSSQNYFGQPISRQCVYYCPDGTFADQNANRQCVSRCSADTYSQNTTKTCQFECITGYANPRTQKCIQICSSGYYGYNGICNNFTCPQTSPKVYADDTTNVCNKTCPEGLYGDSFTLKCVNVCSIDRGQFADDLNQICTTNCPPDYYSDNSTRMCVYRCPQTPDLYAFSGQCVKNCIFGYYAQNSTRSCQGSCPNGTFADNTTNRCVQYCPTKPMMYANSIINKCVYYCSPNLDMYAENISRSCVYNCSQIDNTFADPFVRQCVATCSSGYFAVNSTRRCMLGTCPSGQFADHLIRVCVAKCPTDPIYYGDPHNNNCTQQCPQFSYGNPLTQECVYDVGGRSGCPDKYFSDSTSMLCVLKCPMKYDIYADKLTKRCQLNCTGNQFADNSTMTCVNRCPKYPNYFANLFTMRCVYFCPQNRYADPIYRQCRPNCSEGYYAQNSTRRCIQSCPYQPLSFADNTTNWCVDSCPEGYYADLSTLRCVQTCPVQEETYGFNDTNFCVKVCPNGTYADNRTQTCIANCYNYMYADNSSHRCVQSCPHFPPYYADNTTFRCVYNCPPDMFKYENDRTCVYFCPQPGLYRQNSTKSCVQACAYLDNSYADNLTGYCVERCSEETYANPTQRKCVSICPDQPLLYADNSSQSCVQVCPGSTFGQNVTRSCVNRCPQNSLSLIQKHLCVLYCPIGFFAYNETATCLDRCISPYYGDPSTRSCALSCPRVHLLYADDNLRICVQICPQNFYADKKSQKCVSACPNATLSQKQTYAADYNHQCVQQCALPTFAYKVTLKCVTQCPRPYYNNIVDHICYLCPSVCYSCTSPKNCLACIGNYFLQDGQCVANCTSNRYANTTSMKCVTSLLCKPYYGVNSTRMCSSTCPLDAYKNSNQYRCDKCPQTCLTCTSLINCTTCTNLSIGFNYYCYGYCGDVMNSYYSSDNITCVKICPNGTYLSVVFCKYCLSNCTTCSQTSGNCTLCSNGLYLQSNLCSSSCSSGYKPNTTRICVYCGANCGTGLDFKTNITQVNGQTTIFMNFNGKVNVSGNPNQVFGVTQKKSRRLLQSSNLSYTIVVVDQKTVKIVFPPGTDVPDNYQVSILQPQNVVDEFGNIPQKVRDTVEVDTQNTYSQTVDTISSHPSNYIMFISIICVISFVFDIELMKFLQLVFIHYFVATTLPPQLTKALAAFKYSTLSYLWPVYSVPTALLKDTVPGKIYDLCGDFSFLRNAGFVFTPMIVIIILWIIFKALSIPQINRFKQSRIWFKTQHDQKFKFGVQLQFITIFFTNTIFFIFLQMRDYTMYDSFYQASIVIAHVILFLLILVIAMMAYRVISFFLEYPKLSQNLKKASDIILQQNQYTQFNSTNVFLFQKKKIDLRNLYYPQVNNQNILPFRNIYRFGFLRLCCPIFTMLRSMGLSIIIALAYSSLILQMSLAIPLNFLMLLYMIKSRPYSFKFRKYRIRNYIAIFNQICLILFQLLVLVLGIVSRDGYTAAQKSLFASAIVYYLIIVITINFIYFLFRVYIQAYRKLWLPFIESDIFRQNFPQKYAQYQAQKNKDKKLIKGVDPLAKEYIKSLIAGYKHNKVTLRPNQQDKQHPQLPMKYKITYFDRDNSSVSGSQTSLSKRQRKKLLNQLFNNQKYVPEQGDANFQQLESSQSRTQFQYEQIEQQIQIKAKDLAKYVRNAQQLIQLKKKDQDQNL